MDRTLLHRNTLRRFRSVVAYIVLSDKTRSNILKSDYNRAAVMLACSIVEGLVCDLILERSHPDLDPVIALKTLYKEPHALPSSLVPGDVFIGKRGTEEIKLSDRECTFGRMNELCRDQGWISAPEFRRLTYVKDKRGEMHLHTLKKDDVGYTSRTLNLIAEAADFILNKI